MERCNTCEGIYEPVAADGSLYFHVCPLGVVDESGALRPFKLRQDQNPISTAAKDADTMIEPALGSEPVEE